MSNVVPGFHPDNVSQSRRGDTLKIDVALDVKNIGSRTGTAVPQVYIGFPHIDEGDEPPLQLNAFRKVNLTPGETRIVHLGAERKRFRMLVGKEP